MRGSDATSIYTLRTMIGLRRKLNCYAKTSELHGSRIFFAEKKKNKVRTLYNTFNQRNLSQEIKIGLGRGHAAFASYFRKFSKGIFLCIATLAVQTDSLIEGIMRWWEVGRRVKVTSKAAKWESLKMPSWIMMNMIDGDQISSAYYFVERQWSKRSEKSIHLSNAE